MTGCSNIGRLIKIYSAELVSGSVSYELNCRVERRAPHREGHAGRPSLCTGLHIDFDMFTHPPCNLCCLEPGRRLKLKPFQLPGNGTGGFGTICRDWGKTVQGSPIEGVGPVGSGGRTGRHRRKRCRAVFRFPTRHCFKAMGRSLKGWGPQSCGSGTGEPSVMSSLCSTGVNAGPLCHSHAAAFLCRNNAHFLLPSDKGHGATRTLEDRWLSAAPLLS